MLHNLASAHEGLGRRDRAVELLDESVAIARRVANPVHLSSTLRTLGRMLLQQERESPRALALLRESLEIAADLDERPGIVECLDTLAGVAGRRGDAVTGALLIGAAEATREAAGAGAPARRDAVDPRRDRHDARGARRRGVHRRGPTGAGADDRGGRRAGARPHALTPGCSEAAHQDGLEVELVGLEPTTFWLPARRSPS